MHAPLAYLACLSICTNATRVPFQFKLAEGAFFVFIIAIFLGISFLPFFLEDLQDQPILRA
jgi:hypothetical protein